MKQKLSVQGMGCGSCVAKVEGKLNGTPGVNNAKVDFAEKTVSFEYNQEQVNLQEIADGLAESGYTLVLQD